MARPDGGAAVLDRDMGAEADLGAELDPDAGLDMGPPDAGPIDAPAGEIRCGDRTCEVGVEACRATCGTPDAPRPTCIDAPEGWEIGECPDGTETFPVVVGRCENTEDCGAGSYCGVQRGSLGNYPSCLACEGDEPCPPAATFPPILCHDDGDCPAGACTPDEVLLDGHYSTCSE